MYPGGRVVYRKPSPPTLDEARQARRADISNLFDVSSLHNDELKRVSQLMARQPVGHPMDSPPGASHIPAVVLQLAGLDMPYDHDQQQELLMLQPSPKISLQPPRTQSSKPSSQRPDTGLTSGSGSPSSFHAESYEHGALPPRRTILPPPSRHARPTPASRADVVHLDAVLREHLAAAGGALGDQIRAWDEAFSEMVRQVKLHCTERGVLLDEIRSRYNDWVTRLILAVSELHGARERKVAMAEEEALTQEDRLQELLIANQSLQHKLSVLRRELEWSKKTAGLQGDAAGHDSAAWRKLKSVISQTASGRGDGGPASRGGASGAADPAGGVSGTRLATLSSLLADCVDELGPTEIASLMRVALEGSGGAEDDAVATERSEEVLAQIVEYLPDESQHAMAADMLSGLPAEGMAAVMRRVAEDEDERGRGAEVLADLHVTALHQLASLGPASNESKMQISRIISSLLDSLSSEEQAEILRPFGAGGRGGGRGGGSGGGGEAPAPTAAAYRLPKGGAPSAGAPKDLAKKAATAAKARAEALAGDNDDDSAPGPHAGSPAPEDKAAPPYQVGRSMSRRRDLRKAKSGQGAGLSAGGSRSTSTGPVGSGPDSRSSGRADNEPTNGAAGGVPSISEMLKTRRAVFKELSRDEVFRVIGGAIAMKVETDAAARLSGRPRLHLRDELWRYLCSRCAVRSEAVQMLHDFAAALEAMSTGANANAPNRITAVRHLTGIAAAAGTVWPSVECDFYVLCLHAIFPQWANQPRELYAKVLGRESCLVPLGQAMDAVKYLVTEGTLMHRLHARIKGAAADLALSTTDAVDGIELDWLMQVLMQSWEDSQLAAQRSLQSIFFEADDNGDGILQLEEFYAMIRERKPDMTDAEAFKIYDEALAMSEQMLGYESDAILADAFTRTAINHNLFSGLNQPFRNADETGTDPPPGWGAERQKGGRGGKGGKGGATGDAQEVPLDLLARIGAKREGKQGSTGTLRSSTSVPALPGILGDSSAPRQLGGGGSGSGGLSGGGKRASVGAMHGALAQGRGLLR